MSNLADDIISLKYDIYILNSNCVAHQRYDNINSDSNSNSDNNDEPIVTSTRIGISVKDNQQLQNNNNNEDNNRRDYFEMMIGYSAKVVNENHNSNSDSNGYIRDSTCTEHDMVQVIDHATAQHCLDTLTASCASLKEQMCPCYTLHELKEKQLKQLDTNDNDAAIDTCSNTNTFPIFGLDRSNWSCSKDGVTEKIALNEKQFDHCFRLIELSCKGMSRSGDNDNDNDNNNNNNNNNGNRIPPGDYGHKDDNGNGDSGLYPYIPPMNPATNSPTRAGSGDTIQTTADQDTQQGSIGSASNEAASVKSDAWTWTRVNKVQSQGIVFISILGIMLL